MNEAHHTHAHTYTHICTHTHKQHLAGVASRFAYTYPIGLNTGGLGGCGGGFFFGPLAPSAAYAIVNASTFELITSETSSIVHLLVS